MHVNSSNIPRKRFLGAFHSLSFNTSISSLILPISLLKNKILNSISLFFSSLILFRKFQSHFPDETWYLQLTRYLDLDFHSFFSPKQGDLIHVDDGTWMSIVSRGFFSVDDLIDLFIFYAG
ncbi:hypothetical protein GQ457_04G001050 [Hibiscus cannabinus]